MIAPLQTAEWAEHERDEVQWRWERRNRRRLRHEHGAEGLRLIADLVMKALMRHPGMPERNAWEWAEACYERGEVLC